MGQPFALALKPSRTWPLIANVGIIALISAGMLLKGAHTDYKLHAIIESILTLLSLFIVVVCFSLHRRSEGHFFLVLGLTFAGYWFLELWHILASLEQGGVTLAALSTEFSAAHRIAPRLYLAMGLTLTLLMPQPTQREHGAEQRTDLRFYLAAIAGLVPAIIVGLLASSSWHDAHWGPIVRPEDMILALPFSLASIGYLLRGYWQRNVLEFYLLVFLLSATAIHLLVMPFSPADFDEFYAVAHLLKFSGSIIVLVGLILYARDTSSDILEDERQRAETMLRTMDDGIIVVDSHFIIKSVNPATCKVFGLSEQALIESKLTRLLPGLSLDSQGELAADHLGRRVEIKGLRADTSEFPVEIIFNKLPGKRASKRLDYVCVLRDISDRHAREIERINLNRQLETALKAAGLGRWTWNFNKLCMIWDDQCDKIYGLPPGTRGATRAELAKVIHPDDAEAMRNAFDGVSLEGRFRDAEFRITHSDGSERWIAMSGTRLVGDGDSDERVVGVLRDITQYKSSLQELTEAREAADEASKVKSAFLANMSHEIRTPMNGVVGMLDVLQQSRLDSRQTEMVDVIKESAFSLLHLIDDILDFSKIEAGKLSVEIAPMNVAAVTESVCASLELLAQESGVELALFTDPELPEAVMGDSLRLRQVLVNLVNNAIKFSKDNTRVGKISIRASLVEESTDEASLEFRVDDNGIGMTQEVQDAVFDIFVQADSSTSRKFGGTGLGLTISKNLVEMMGGDIKLFSVPGEGSTFTVRVTLPKTVAEDTPARREWHLDGVDCLLLEEHRGYSDHLAAYLDAAGAVVEHVGEVTEALQWLNNNTGQRRVCIVDGGAARLTAVERKLLERENLGVIVIQRQRRQLVSHIKDALVHNGNAMTQRHFLQLVSVAAGKTSPLSEDSPAGSARQSMAVAPSREQALADNELILVVEDNLTNQHVILEQLTVLGYHADIANHGEEGLRMWRSGDYALVLTDLQMPRMDGYQLAAEIRAEELGNTRIPIIALSADALVGEAERSTEIGMDDYLSKPARLEDLEKVLAKWIKRAPDAATQPRPGAAETPDSPVLDISVLESLVGTDRERIATLINAYRTSLSDICTPLRDAWHAHDSETLGQWAHQLKSSSLSVGATRLGQLAAHVESIARETGSVPAPDLVSQFNLELDAVNQAIADWDSGSPRSHPQPA